MEWELKACFWGDFYKLYVHARAIFVATPGYNGRLEKGWSVWFNEALIADGIDTLEEAKAIAELYLAGKEVNDGVA